jgi:hypothetical protein
MTREEVLIDRELRNCLTMKEVAIKRIAMFNEKIEQLRLKKEILKGIRIESKKSIYCRKQRKI